ncbi:MAG: serine hydrolase [Actinobacteria bacterium]|nr:serine hydrolase [Actinomycetota bacterium]MBI3686347.1 serine hydrolase [Actinomycetota bacterium]
MSICDRTGGQLLRIVVAGSLSLAACGGAASPTPGQARPTTPTATAPAPPTGPLSPSQVDAALRSVSARATYGVFDVTGGTCRELRALRPGQVFPLASAFKLWVLDALARQIGAGRARWDETFPVADRYRSDPSGTTYQMRTGTPVTLRRYAELMISESDNTATDHLIGRLGRETVEAAMVAAGARSAERNIPLLFTAEMARLKFVSPATGDRYLALRSVPARRAFLSTTVASIPLSLAQPPDPDAPRHIDDLEWFATAADMCRTMVDLDTLTERPGLGPVADILQINPGLPPELVARWASVRYKGGSEPGVVSGIYWLRRPDGVRRVVAFGLTSATSGVPQTAAGQAGVFGLFTLAHDLP